MNAAPARPEIDRLLDLMDETVRAARTGRPTSGWMDLDLTLGQIRFLHVLNRAGALSIGHVADQLGVTLTTASQFVSRLERRGYVERVHGDEDRRVVECRLTERGVAVTVAMKGMQREVLGALLSHLKPRELLVLERIYGLMLKRAAAAASAPVGGSTLTPTPSMAERAASGLRPSPGF